MTTQTGSIPQAIIRLAALLAKEDLTEAEVLDAVQRHADRVGTDAAGRVLVQGVVGSDPIAVLAHEIVAAATGAAPEGATPPATSPTYLRELKAKLLKQREDEATAVSERQQRFGGTGRETELSKRLRSLRAN